MKVTIKDIAKAAGVTPRTVTNALRQSEKGIRADARERAERIRKIAEEMGYRPNAGARAMRRGNYQAFGVLNASKAYAGALNQSAQWGLLEKAAESGYHIAIGHVSDEQLAEPDGLPKLIEQWMVDGMAISYATEAPRALIEALDKWKLPAIWINVKRDFDAVRPDDYGDARKTVKLLIEHGHKRILYLDRFGGGPSHYSVADRRQGYLNAMEGLSPRVVVPPPQTGKNSQPQLEWAVELLRAAERPTAVFAYSLEHALWFRDAAHRIGLNVPADLSIMGFSQATTRQSWTFSPGQIVLPDFEIGRTIVRMLLEKIKTENKPIPSRVLPGEITPGDTVATAPQS